MILIVYLLIFLPLITGVLIYLLDKPLVNRGIFLLQIVLGGLLGIAIAPKIFLSSHLGQVTFVTGGWSKLVGIGIRIDPLSFLFLTMNLLSFCFIWLYIWPNRKHDHKFLFFLCALETALNGLFTTNDLFAIFVLIELVTILASILITYKKDALSVRAGLFYLLYNSWAMILYLLGIICFYWYAGNLNIDLVAPLLVNYKQEPVLAFGLAAIVVGLGIKSAFFMLHLWLPQAHSAAPASISAILSGLIVKMGVFVFLRIDGLISIPAVHHLFLYVGLISGIFGALFAIFQSDLKRILAFHTVSQLGLIFIGLGLYGEKNTLGAIAHLFNHFAFKSLLFLAVGLIIMETGERRVKYIRGLWQWHKPLSLCLGIGIVSIIGFPLFSGSFSKMLIKSGDVPSFIKLGLYLINFGTLISFIKLSTTLFGKPSEALSRTKRTHDRVMAGVYFITAVVLLCLPVELWLSGKYMPDLSHYYFSKIGHDTLTFLVMLLASIGLYQWIVKPLIKKFPHLGHQDISFGHAVASSLFFFWFALSYFA